MKFRKSIILVICVLSIIFISILPSYVTGLEILKYNQKNGIHLYWTNFNHKGRVTWRNKRLVRYFDRRFYPQKLRFAFMKGKWRHGQIHN
ncbi:hypothetical protein K0039_07440 [Terrisporobacter mayombei]|uniref:Uncharacterized protein n=1 Tax=Terrisporobacter mayombei TaxID=1541 RepID=A0ABY9Q0Q8_9FIRM|nr:hypothetical protein [Terrisporobacter mayombei]MCC3868034.1 hypothetical protein [Terrisporobacter mayombei]WMT80172.1 hypothetical protein TEMA_04850 [Terrisporobacter mayombei]